MGSGESPLLAFCLPVDDERKGPLNDVIKGKGFQATERELRGIRIDDRLLLLRFNGQNPQELRDEVMRHQVNLQRDNERKEDSLQGERGLAVSLWGRKSLAS